MRGSRGTARAARILWAKNRPTTGACATWWGTSGSGAMIGSRKTTISTVPSGTRVVRGGCWNSKPDYCRAAYRYYEMPAYSDICFAKDLHGQIGFRCGKKQPAK